MHSVGRYLYKLVFISHYLSNLVMGPAYSSGSSFSVLLSDFGPASLLDIQQNISQAMHTGQAKIIYRSYLM